MLDELEAAALALGDGGNRVLLIGVDSEGIAREVLQEFRENISRETGVPVEGIFIAATHTHTGPVTARSPFILDARDEELAEEYTRFLYRRLLQVSVLALEDMQPARMGYGCGKAPGIAYVRRFRMKDGSIRTNPGINNRMCWNPSARRTTACAFCASTGRMGSAMFWCTTPTTRTPWAAAGFPPIGRGSPGEPWKKRWTIPAASFSTARRAISAT